MHNPFEYDFPININELPSRQRIVTRVIERLKRGKSTAIIGEPRLAKTSLLEYISDPKNYDLLYGNYTSQILFSYINCQTLPTQYTSADFWRSVFGPLEQQLIIQAKPSEKLVDIYAECKWKNFEAFDLENLVHQINQDGIILALMLDEYDVILDHSGLNNLEFFGTLRHLSAFADLAVIASCRQSLLELERQIPEHGGSPVFNFFDSVELSFLSMRDLATLFDKTQDRFDALDRRYIWEVSGGHPHFVKLAAAKMWEISDSDEANRQRKYSLVGLHLHREAHYYLNDIWNLWTTHIQKAVMSIAMLQAPSIVGNNEFYTKPLIRNLSDFSPEVRELERIGWVIKDSKIPGGYRITQGVMLWWLADELLRITREEVPLEVWLRGWRFSGFLTKKEIENLTQATKSFSKLLEKGATTLIEAYAKSVIEKP